MRGFEAEPRFKLVPTDVGKGDGGCLARLVRLSNGWH